MTRPATFEICREPCKLTIRTAWPDDTRPLRCNRRLTLRLLPSAAAPRERSPWNASDANERFKCFSNRPESVIYTGPRERDVPKRVTLRTLGAAYRRALVAMALGRPRPLRQKHGFFPAQEG